MLSSVMEPPPMARLIMVNMGPKQMVFTTMMTARASATRALLRASFLLATGRALQAMITARATTRATPSTIKWVLTLARTLITS